MRARLATAAVAAAAFLTLPAAAQAANVSLSPGEEDEPATLTYAAAVGEQNKVDIEVNGATAEVSDPGADSITAGSNCTQQGAKKATCTLPSGTIQRVNALLIDGNDTFDVSGAPSDADGGAGDDTLRGGPLADTLRGGGGTDTLRGNAGDDTLSDGDTTATANKDTVDGGPDVDWVEYSARTVPVTVNLADDAGDGQQGENDDVDAVENVTGGQAGDDLRGTDGPNTLQGLTGDDKLDGRGGNDRLGDTAGNDTLVGGPGSDDIDASDGDDTLRLDNPPGEYDRLLTCGDGKDTIVGLAAKPSVSIQCELGDFGFGFVTGLKPKKVTKTDVTVKIPCPEPYRANGRCKGSIAVEPTGAYARSDADRKKQRYGARSFAITGSSAKIRIPLNAAGDKQLRKSAFKLQFTINLKETATKTKRRFEWTSYLVRSFL